MSPFWRHTPPPVVADVDEGFVATEAPALQQAIRSALRFGEGDAHPVSAELRFLPGAEDRVVVSWRNRYVGFVPSSHALSVRLQLDAVGRSPLVTPGEVYHDGKYWRVWVGSPPPGGPPRPSPGYDELEPPPLTIFGVPVGRMVDRAKRPPVRRWVLTVDGSSWDVRDGVDFDLAELRSRVRGAGDGGEVNLWLFDQPVTIRLTPGAVVTLTPPDGGPVERLYPPS